MFRPARTLRIALGAAALTALAAPASSSTAFANDQRGPSPRANQSNGDQDARSGRRSGKSRFADGILVGRHRREGMYSSLTLGFSNCLDGRNNANCDRGFGLGSTKGSVGFTKEMGYRIPWFFGGLSYSLGFMRPSRGFDPVDTAYQHSILVVLRPTLPIWRVDFGVNVAPGWSRQVARGSKWSDRVYTQGFALGLGVVAALNITRKWIIGMRWDAISNFHGKTCISSSNSSKVCTELPDGAPAAVNQGLTGLFLSHRW